jgi:hypothetical protein
MRKLVLLVLLVGAAIAADKAFWTQKPYAKWSQRECEKLLSDSPWAKSMTLRRPAMREINRGFGQTASGDSGTGERDPEIVYTVQIRSAQPLREAYIRMKGIQGHVDAMSDDAKTRVQQRFDEYLAQPFDDKIVVLVQYKSNLPEVDTMLANYWQGQTVGTLKNSVYLSGPDGDHMEPTAYVGGSGADREFQFVFPRNPAAAQANPEKAIEFEFLNMVPNRTAGLTTVTIVNAGARMHFTFQPKDMKVGDRIVY